MKKKILLVLCLLSFSNHISAIDSPYSSAFGRAPGYFFWLTYVQAYHPARPSELRFSADLQGIPERFDIMEEPRKYMDGEYLIEIQVIKRNYYPKRHEYKNNQTLTRVRQFVEYRYRATIDPPYHRDFPINLNIKFDWSKLEENKDLIYRIRLHQVHFFGLASKWSFGADIVYNVVKGKDNKFHLRRTESIFQVENSRLLHNK